MPTLPSPPEIRLGKACWFLGTPGLACAPACGTCTQESQLLTLGTPTLVSHHWVMHSQQNKWPHGVAVECLRSSRHSVHVEFLEMAFSSMWLLGAGQGDANI